MNMIRELYHTFLHGENNISYCSCSRTKRHQALPLLLFWKCDFWQRKITYCRFNHLEHITIKMTCHDEPFNNIDKENEW